MTVPFMRAYTELLVKTCHRRGAHAMGGMAAVIPSRTDEEANERAFEAVRDDKAREAGGGLRRHLGRAPRLGARWRWSSSTPCSASGPTRSSASATTSRSTAAELLDVAATPGEVTEAGLRSNVNVGIQYISSWLRGNGAAAIYGLMEDAATAEIARGQVWQWVRHGVAARRRPGDHARAGARAGRPTSWSGSARRSATTSGSSARAGPTQSRELFERVALGDEFVEFLTLPAYERLEG